MTDRKKQDWVGMSGVTAFHLIEQHADNWDDIGSMMDDWLKANVLAEREACAKVCEMEAADWKKPKYAFASAAGEHCAIRIRARSK